MLDRIHREEECANKRMEWWEKALWVFAGFTSFVGTFQIIKFIINLFV